MTNNKRNKRNPSINLSEIGIKPGAKLRFVPASEVYTDIFVTVVDNNNIEYNGEIMSRHMFNMKFNQLQRQGTKTKTMQSTRYLYYKGNSLADIWKTYCETNEILAPTENSEKAKDKSKEGYVYVLRNPSFKENIFKIGNSTDYIRRMKELDTTGIPTPFEAVAVIWVPNCNEVEKYFLETLALDIKKIRQNREFFEGDEEKIKIKLHKLVEILYYEKGKIVV